MTQISQPAQPTSTTNDAPIAHSTPIKKTKQHSPVGKKGILLLIVALLFFAGGLGTWIYVEYFF